jgi:hypothetical protein
MPIPVSSLAMKKAAGTNAGGSGDYEEVVVGLGFL